MENQKENKESDNIPFQQELSKEKTEEANKNEEIKEKEIQEKIKEENLKKENEKNEEMANDKKEEKEEESTIDEKNDENPIENTNEENEKKEEKKEGNNGEENTELKKEEENKKNKEEKNDEKNEEINKNVTQENQEKINEKEKQQKEIENKLNNNNDKPGDNQNTDKKINEENQEDKKEINNELKKKENGEEKKEEIDNKKEENKEDKKEDKKIEEEIKEEKGEEKKEEKGEDKKEEEKKEEIKEDKNNGDKKDLKEEKIDEKKEENKENKIEEKKEDKEKDKNEENKKSEEIKGEEKKEETKKESKEEDKKEEKKDELKDEIKVERKEEKKEEIKQEKKVEIKEDKPKDDKNKKDNQNKIIEEEKQIPEGFTIEDQEKINKYISTNYKEFYSKNYFCDYFTEREWRAGFILEINDNYLKIIDATNKSPNKEDFSLVKIKIGDSQNVSYFRKYSHADNYMVKGSAKNLKTKLSQFTNFHNKFKEYIEYCENYEFYYFLRATIYYGLDFCMNPTIINSKDSINIEISFRLILIILNIISDCLIFIKDNLDDFLKFQNKIKENNKLKDYVLLSNKFAIYSFFDDIQYLMKKLFGDSSQYLEWYTLYKDEIMKFIPTINENPQKNSISELFPLYKDQKGGNSKYKLMDRICLKEVYNKNHFFHTLDKSINSCIIAYFVDYFNYTKGYDTLFTILCSIYHNKEDKLNLKIQFSIIASLFQSKIITGSFSNHMGIELIKKYIDQYTEKACDESALNMEDDLQKLFLKLIELIQNKDEEKKLLTERIQVIFFFKQLDKTKKLEKNINIVTNINNIIKSVQYNDLYKEIKEKNNTDKNEEMLNDVQFQGRNENIKEMSEAYFCKLCQENKIIELLLDNQTTHEEIIKRIYPLLFIMYKNNFGYTQKNEQKIKYIFDTLFQKVKESEQNNESLWKIILQDIILEFSEKLDINDRNYVFSKLSKYFEETAIKKNSKIIQLITLIINYSLKCIGSNVNNQNEKDYIFNENYRNKDEYEKIITGKFNEKKYYCLELLINHLIDKRQINDFGINSELKINVINTCIDGIIDILKKLNSNDDIIKIIFIRIFNGILSSSNITDNITLLQKIFKLDINKKAKEGINNYCKDKNIIKIINKEFSNFLNNINEENMKIEEYNKELQIELSKRIDLLFLLLENDITISNEDFTLFFNQLTISNEFSKKIFYTKMKENILKINIKLREYIFENILLNKNKETNFEIKDSMSYQIVKEFILQINKSKGKFIFITEKDMMVLSKDYNCKDIYGHKELWDLLLRETNNDIRNDIANFLSNIYLGIKYQLPSEYDKFWKNIISLIVEKLSHAINGNNINNDSVKGIICLIKKIRDNSNKDGDIIINKSIINNLLESFKIKSEGKKDNKINNENKDMKVEAKKSGKKDNKKDKINEIKEDLNKEKNEEIPARIVLEYFESQNEDLPAANNDENKEKKTRIVEIYNNEYFYTLRYIISNEFKIPLKCIQLIKKSNQNTSASNIPEKKNVNPLEKKKTIKTNKANLFCDYIFIIEQFPELKQYMTKKNKKESNEKLPVFTVEKIQNPLNDNERDNLTTLIAKSSELANLLQKLSKNKNNDYGMDIWSIINDKKDLNEEKGQEINKIIEELINNSDNKNDNQKKNY